MSSEEVSLRITSIPKVCSLAMVQLDFFIFLFLDPPYEWNVRRQKMTSFYPCLPS